MKNDANEPEPCESLASLIEQNRAIPLGRFLRGLARASAMASAIAAAGCGGSEAAPETVETREIVPWIDPAEAIEPICEAAYGVGSPNLWRPTQGLTPAIEYDYLGVYTCSEDLDGDGYLTDTDGEPCDGTTDPDQCEMLIEAQYDCPALHVRSGDSFRLLKAGDDLMQFFGTVDTAQEALLVAFLDGNLVRCGDVALASAKRVDDGFEVIVTRVTAICDPIESSRFLFHVDPDGTITELRSEVYESLEGWCIGRRPDGLHPGARCSANHSAAGRHFSRIATLEAAAVEAFCRLATELEALGAPADLVRDALRAADDEVRHTAVMTGVARHFGAEPNPPSVDPAAPRDALTIAIENAVEGTVRETFGALTGSYQSMTASDPVVADAMRQVSEDEISHAELSARIDAFLQTRLTDAERELLAEAKRRAIAELRLEVSVERDPELAALAGAPPRDLSLSWIALLERQVWAKA